MQRADAATPSSGLKVRPGHPSPEFLQKSAPLPLLPGPVSSRWSAPPLLPPWFPVLVLEENTSHPFPSLSYCWCLLLLIVSSVPMSCYSHWWRKRF